MSETDTETTTPDQRPEGEIVFGDRKIKVRMPAPEQILVWRRTMTRLEGANVNDWSGKEVMDAMERTRKIIDTVIVDPTDIDWLDDEMLAGRVGIRDAANIVVSAVQVFQNRAGRRAAAKKTPARLKAPAKKTAAKKTTPRKRAAS